MKMLGILDCNSIAPKVKEEIAPNARKVPKIVTANAMAKAKYVLKNMPRTKAVVIGADTVVCIGNLVLGKPKSEAQAREYLEMLSNSTHEVITGLALVSRYYGHRTLVVKSRVKFRRLTHREIENYLETREPYDKAGAYGVQGLASLFIEKVEGSYTNVIGFPVEYFLKELAKLTEMSPHNWFLKAADD